MLQHIGFPSMKVAVPWWTAWGEAPIVLESRCVLSGAVHAALGWIKLCYCQRHLCYQQQIQRVWSRLYYRDRVTHMSRQRACVGARIILVGYPSCMSESGSLFPAEVVRLALGGSRADHGTLFTAKSTAARSAAPLCLVGRQLVLFIYAFAEFDGLRLLG